MSRSSAESPPPPPYASPAAPSHQHSSCNSGNPGHDDHQVPPLAPWQRRWNVEWLNQAMIPNIKQKFLLVQPAIYRDRYADSGVVLGMEDTAASIIADAIAAGIVSKENRYKGTRLDRVLRAWTSPLQLFVRDVKAFKKCWREYKNKDKMWKVTAVMEEQGENPRWQAEMTFTIQQQQYNHMVTTGEWFEFPSPEDIKWLYVTDPSGRRRLHATDQRHWGPNPAPSKTSQPFGVRDGCIVRHPDSPALTRNFHSFVEQVGPRRCNHCGCAEYLTFDANWHKQIWKQAPD
ncbi:hypothetical protein F4803DRAFT_498835 [Xylaria telfairii]|nr:hypothetical protein F4803DRAFT_498835 [Xylaria telfairii]